MAMLSFSRPLVRSRFAAMRGSSVGGAVLVAALLSAPVARASSPGPQSSAQSSLAPLRLGWRVAPPTLRLQPEGARLVLSLPAELMPPPDLGRLGFQFDPNKYWMFRTRQQLTSASIGQGLRLSIEDREHDVWFGISVLPRAAVAVLRFDPMPAQMR